MIKLKEISTSKVETLEEAASLVSRYSWGYDYPVKPINEIQKAEQCVGAYINNQLVGFATLGRSFSPDGRDNQELWLAHAVVIPAFRGQGIFKKLYSKLIKHDDQKNKTSTNMHDKPNHQKILIKSRLEKSSRYFR